MQGVRNVAKLQLSLAVPSPLSENGEITNALLSFLLNARTEEEYNLRFVRMDMCG